MNPLHVSESLAAGFSPILLDAAFKSTVLLVLTAAALRCMRPCSAATRHFTLFIVVGSLLVLPMLSWALPRLDVLPAWWGGPSRASKSPGVLRAVAAPVAAPASGTAANEPVRQGLPATSPAEASVQLEREHGGRSLDTVIESLGRWAPAAWLVGFLCALAPAAIGWLSLWRLQRTSCVEASGRLGATLDRLAARLGLRRRVQLLTTQNRQMPMAWGVLRPRVLLPAESLEWPEARQQVVLLHELAHVRRSDFVTTLVTRVVCALYWFNPLVWLAARRLRLEQEQACDDAVLTAGTRPAAYAEEVLRIAAGRTVGSLEASGALAMARPSTLEGRLLAILDGSRNRSALNRVAVAGTMFFTGLAVVPMAMLQAGHSAAAASPAVSPALPAAAAEATTPASNRGLIAWWRGEGDGKDSAGKHDGEFPFGIRYLPGFSGQTFDFRRSYAIQDILQRVSIPDSPDFQLSETMTLEARIHPMRFGGIVLLRGDERAGFDTWQLDLITPGKISFNFDDAKNKSVELLAPIQLNKWQHVVTTFDRGAMKIYIDGVLGAEAQTELRPNAILDPKYNPALGIGDSGGKHYSIPFDGLIDEVRIYSRALTAAEIAERFKG